METKFTEGPWNIDIKEDNCDLFVINVNGHDHYCFLVGNDIPTGDYHGTGVAVIAWPIEGDTPEVREMMKANAHLIAAAPELYKMLQESIGTICKNCQGLGQPKDCVGQQKDPCEEIAGYRAVLAKARGEPNTDLRAPGKR